MTDDTVVHFLRPAKAKEEPKVVSETAAEIEASGNQIAVVVVTSGAVAVASDRPVRTLPRSTAGYLILICQNDIR